LTNRIIDLLNEKVGAKMYHTDNCIVINCFEEYITEILNSNENIGTIKPQRFISYRGQPDVKYNIMPAIGRGRRFSIDNSIMDQERNLIEMAKNKLPNIFNRGLTPINLLALLQHYGIPTRLLDITSNPLVALYFASSEGSTDGEVIVFEHKDSVVNYPIFNAIAESYKFAHSTITTLDYFYGCAIQQKYFEEQRYELKEESNASGGEWIRRCCNQELFVISAQEQSERQRRQQGLYILFPNKIVDCASPYFEKVIAEIPKDHEQIKKRIIIKKDLKADIRKKLEILGISNATLFYDNIDAICQDIVYQCRNKI